MKKWFSVELPTTEKDGLLCFLRECDCYYETAGAGKNTVISVYCYPSLAEVIDDFLLGY